MRNTICSLFSLVVAEEEGGNAVEEAVPVSSGVIVSSAEEGVVECFTVIVSCPVIVEDMSVAGTLCPSGGKFFPIYLRVVCPFTV
jgi:hypothetical protein